jgi:AraC-like DNA-binding protein
MQSIQQAIAPMTALNWLLAGGAFSVMSIGLGELFLPNKRAINFVTSALGLSFGLAVLIYLAQTLGLYRDWPFILYLYYPLELLVGTLLFFFFTLLVEGDFRLASPWLFLFLPVLAATGLMLPYFLAPASSKIAQMPLYKTGDPFFHAVYGFIAHNLETWVIGNIALFLARTGLGLRKKRLVWMRQSRDVLALAGVLFCVVVLCIWVNFFPSELSRKIAILALILAAYPIYFFKQKNPGLFGLVAAAARGDNGASPRHSTKLAGVDTRSLMEGLDRLMREERLFTDSELGLQGLSERLGVSPHQLSEFLNSRLGINFRQYLNGFRIEAAKTWLRDNPERSILDIAFECGFGSKSAFNSAFARTTGMSPSQWIEAQEGERGE